MIFKFRYRRTGGHVHVRVFAGTNPDALGLAGNLTFRPDEWEAFGDLALRGRMPATLRPIWTEVVDDTGNQPVYDLPLDVPAPIPPDYADSAE